MFKCKDCGSKAFNLVMQASGQHAVDIQTNEHQEVVIVVNGQEFIADLLFMNQFAVCTQCAGIKRWEYHFPTKQKMA